MTPPKNRRPSRTPAEKMEQPVDVKEEQVFTPTAAPVTYDGYAPSSEDSAAPEAPPSYAARERTADYADQQRRSTRQRVAEPEYDRTGDILRYARQQRGESIATIADYLRIRPGFLEALEACRYEDLPADAYVIGFLRSYAIYLGFDGKTAIDHYRREMAGRRRKPQLAMPQPVAESRAPSVAILIAAVAAALLIYGIWYVFSTSDRAAVSLPPPMPETAVEEQVAPAAENAGAATAPETAPEASQGAAPAAAAPGNDAQQPAPAAAGAQPPSSQPQSSQPAATTPEANPPAATPAQPAANAPVQQPAPATTSPAPAPQPSAAVPLTPAPAQVNVASAGQRLVLKATKECWIQVSDSTGKVWVDKTMKAGDTYTPPTDKKDLKLTIGNVKGLDIVVDGAVLKPLSTDGRVLRGIALDPDTLKSRAGVATPSHEAAPASNAEED